MAHIVGVPKRDPCQKCGLPVFLAERLMIGKNVYHRTCLRCARCNSQLTPGNFYETEIDGEYCCETCPDEEKKLDVATSSKDRVLESVESKPIAARLAFFEKDGTKVLQKSLSDEEKSQSLKKFTENQLQYIYKPNSARSSFLNNPSSGEYDSRNSSRRNSDSSTDTTSSDKTNDDVSKEPPELPKSLPPLLSEDETHASSSFHIQESTISTIELDNKTTPKVPHLQNIQVETVICEMSSVEQVPSPEPSVVDPYKSESKTKSVEIENDISGAIPKQEIKINYIYDDTFSNRNASIQSLEPSITRYKNGANINETHFKANSSEAAAIQVKCLAKSNNTMDFKSQDSRKSGSNFESIDKPKSLQTNSSILTTESEEATDIKRVAFEETPQQIGISDMRNIQIDMCGEQQIKNPNIEGVQIESHILSQEPSVVTESKDSMDFKSQDSLKSGFKFKNIENICRSESLEIKPSTEDVDITGNKNDICVEIPQKIQIPHMRNIKHETEIYDPTLPSRKALEALEHSTIRFRSGEDGEEIHSKGNNSENSDIQQIWCGSEYSHNMDLKSQEVDIGRPQSLQTKPSMLNTENVEAAVIKSDICREIPRIKKIQLETDIKGAHMKLGILFVEEEPSRASSKNCSFDQQQDNSVEFCNDLNLIKHSINVTKDNSENDGEMRTINVPTTSESIRELPTTDPEQPVVDSESSKSMVRTRLHQFEDIANKSQNSSISSLSKNRLSHSANSGRTCNVNCPQSLEKELCSFNLEMGNDCPAINSISNEMEEHASCTLNENGSENQSHSPEDNMKSRLDELYELDKSEKLHKLHKSDASDKSEKPDNLDELEKSDTSDKSDKVDNLDKLDKKEEVQKKKSDDYPEELNPFKSDEEEDNQCSPRKTNPFESSDEDETINKAKVTHSNPFGSESEDDNVSSRSGKLPVPTPRITKSSEKFQPAVTQIAMWRECEETLHNTQDCCGAVRLDQYQDVRSSIKSTYCGCTRGVTKNRKKKPAPQPPKVSKEIFSSINQDSKKSSPGSSTASTPTTMRKKRPAPSPPGQSKTEGCLQGKSDLLLSSMETASTAQEEVKIEKPQAQLEKLCDEEKVLLESSTNICSNESSNTTLDQINESTKTSKRRLIALDASLVEDANSSEDLKLKEEDNVVYRRTLVPPVLDDSTLSPSSDTSESHDRQLEKMKDNKEAKNRNRQSQISLPSEENDPLYNKSVHGKWKRRKGPAPALPVPPKKVLQMLPLQEIRHELEIIEVQQQGLEKQGVMLEKMIRERCEGPAGGDNIEGSPNPPNSKEVEDLILQLFELVNEKNELFRRQAELMYLRRQHRLEQEQADLEYEIRVLMAQPERNKTDSDKAREEALIARLVEVVQLRNEVVECLEMDRLREAEEDLSIKQRLEMHSAKRDEELSKQTPTKLSKKEKKKQKEHKKIGKSKKLDADKDADESELNAEKQKAKKKKKKFLF